MFFKYRFLIYLVLCFLLVGTLAGDFTALKKVPKHRAEVLFSNPKCKKVGMGLVEKMRVR